jgi:hypothetical protein
MLDFGYLSLKILNFKTHNKIKLKTLYMLKKCTKYLI